MKKLRKVLVVLIAIAMVMTSMPASARAAGKSNGTVKLSKKNVTVNKGKTKKVKVKTTGKSKFTKAVIDKNTNKKIAKVSVKKNTITVKGKKKGSSKVTVKVTYKLDKKTKSKKLKLGIKVTDNVVENNTNNVINTNNNNINNNIGYNVIPSPVITNQPYQPVVTTVPTQTPKADYTVTFVSNGGTKIESMSVCNGETVEKPETPVKRGNTFSAWYTDKELTQVYDFDDRVRSNITLYAGWIECDDDKTYTRSEWIGILTEVLGVSVDGINIENESLGFADISEDENAVWIEVAYRYGMLPNEVEDELQDVPMFYPEKTVDREYMAYTICKAMGFEKTDSYVRWDDASESTYPDEIYAVVNAEIMRLDEDNRFNPTDYASEEDVEIAKVMLQYWKTLGEIKDEAHDYSTYSEDVVDLSEVTDYSISENGNNSILTINETVSADVNEGDTIILGKNDDNTFGAAAKVVRVKKDGTYVCKEPKVEEIYSDIDIVGSGVIDYENATVTEGIDMTYSVISEEDGDDYESMAVGGTLNPTGVEFNYDLGEGKEITDSLKLAGKVKVTIPEITALIDADVTMFGLDVNELTLSVTEKVDIDGGLYWTIAESGQSLQSGSYENAIQSIFEKAKGSDFEAGRIEVGEIPINIAYGFGVKFKVFIEMSMEGEVSISYSITGTQGLQYKNNSFRFINDYADSLSMLKLSGKGSVELGLAFDVCFWEIFDIVGVTFQIGPTFEVSMTPHITETEALICGNASLYLGAKFTLDQETWIGEFLKEVLHMTLEDEVLGDDSDNPFRMNFHMENFKVVDECTFGIGTIQGTVLSASDNEPIKNAKINIYHVNEDGRETLVETCYSNPEGVYTNYNLHAGKYNLKISANEYKECDIYNVEVLSDAVAYVDTVRMVKRIQATGIANVTVLDATNGEGLSDWTYVIESLNAAYDEEDISGTSSSSVLDVELNIGNYRITVVKDDYISTSSYLFIEEDEETSITIAVSPTLDNIDGSVRFVLNWGSTPSDLDSHLFIKDEEGNRVGHIYFNNMTYSNDKTYAYLDIDDTSSYGPETITIEDSCEDYTYSYYVYDYTNRNSSYSDELSKSSATVKVCVGEEVLYTFNVPYNVDATAWKLFDYNPKTGNLTMYNQMGFSQAGEEFGN